MFDLRYIDSKDFPGYNDYIDMFEKSKRYWTKNEKASSYIDKAINTLKPDKLPVLIIKDYNTKGIEKPYSDNDFSPWKSITVLDGASKARFLKSVLGYKIGDSKLLHNAIGEAINGKLPNFVERTKFGLKYTFNAKIKGKDGTYKFANVVVVIQNDNGKTTWRIITLYPDKKD